MTTIDVTSETRNVLKLELIEKITMINEKYLPLADARYLFKCTFLLIIATLSGAQVNVELIVAEVTMLGTRYVTELDDTNITPNSDPDNYQLW